MSKAKWLNVTRRGAIRVAMLCCLFALMNVVSAQAESILSITTEQLMQAYEENEVAADMNFKGKTVRTSGVISELRKISGYEVVSVTIAHRSTIWDGAHAAGTYHVREVCCYFNSEGMQDIIALKKGDRVTIQGDVLGKERWYVVLGPCRVVQ